MTDLLFSLNAMFKGLIFFRKAISQTLFGVFFSDRIRRVSKTTGFSLFSCFHTLKFYFSKSSLFFCCRNKTKFSSHRTFERYVMNCYFNFICILSLASVYFMLMKTQNVPTPRKSTDSPLKKLFNSIENDKQIWKLVDSLNSKLKRNYNFKPEYRKNEHEVNGTYHHFYRPENLCRNRYRKCPLYDHSRFILSTKRNNSDYIHASWVDGFNKKNAFILTQGKALFKKDVFKMKNKIIQDLLLFITERKYSFENCCT